MSSSKPNLLTKAHLQILSHWGLWLQYMNLAVEGYKRWGWREANLVHSINAHMYNCVNVAYNEPAGPETHCSQGMRNHDA